MRPTRADPNRIYSELLALLPLAAAAPLCVAFSGGADSTALLGLLASLPHVKSRLRAMHIDHGLQVQSRGWMRACRALCHTLEVPFATQSLTLRRTRGQSTEALARNGRYAALAQALRPGEVLLTAHHLEDQVETVLLQLLRGAGLPGLAAMPGVTTLGTGYLVRPLLAVPRAHLLAWVQERGLPVVDDPSNTDPAFDRNYLRHQVLPAVFARFSGAARTIARSAGHIAAAQGLLDELARSDVARAADGAALSVATLRALPPARRRNALRYWIGMSGNDAPDARQLEEIAVPLLAARSDANPIVTFGQMQVQRHAGRLLLEPKMSAPPAYELTWELKRKHLILPSGAGSLELEASPHGPIDAALLPTRVTVKSRQGGERLRPKARGPSRALKSLLQMAAISLAERQYLPLLFADGHLVAAADLWVDARWQPGDTKSGRRMRLIWHRPG